MSRAGVFISEIDLSQIVGTNTGFYGGMQLKAPKGKLGLNLVTVSTQLIEEYTSYGTVQINYDEAFFEALFFLRNSNKLWIDRIVNNASYSSAVIFTNGSDKFKTTEATFTATASTDLLRTTDTSFRTLMYSGLPVTLVNTGGGLPAGLSVATTYYVIKSSGTEFKLATTLANALAGTAINITTAGTGVHTVISSISLNDLSASVTLDVTGNQFKTVDTRLINALQTGMTLRINTLSKLPINVVENDTYYAIKTGEKSFQIAATLADAQALVPVPIVLSKAVIQETATFGGTLSSTATFTNGTDLVTLASADLDKVLQTGASGYFTNSGGAVPAGLVASTKYYIIRVSDTTFKLATSAVNAAAGTAIDFTTDGTGTTTFLSNGVILGSSVLDNLLQTGTKGYFEVTGGSLPAPLQPNTDYYVVRLSGTLFALATSVANATANIFIDITGTLTGTATFFSRVDVLTQKVISPQNKTPILSDTFESDDTLDEITLGADSDLLNYLYTSKKVRFSAAGGSLPAPLLEGTDYYIIDPVAQVIPNTHTIYNIAETLDDAINSVPINITTAGTGVFSIHIKELDPESFAFDADECLYFYGKDPGLNTHAIRVLDNRSKLPDSFRVEVYSVLDLVDPLESFICSRVPSKKDGNNKNIYIENVMKASKFVRCNDNQLIDGTIFPQFQVSPLRLGGGDIGDDVTTGDLILGLDKWKNTSKYPLTVFMDVGNAVPSYQQAILNLAFQRGDCVGVLSTPIEYQLDSNYLEKLRDYKAIELNANSSYGAIYTPHVGIVDPYNNREEIFVSPTGAVGGLIAKTGADFRLWYPVAGKTRGAFQGLVSLKLDFTDGELDYLYDQGINPIRIIENDGIYLWGQKTLLNIASALDRLNVRLLLTVVKPATLKAMENFVFEFNDAATRSNVTRLLEAYYGQIQVQRGIYGSLIVCNDINNSALDIDNYIMNTWIFIKPTKASEFLPVKLAITRTDMDFSLAQQLIA